MVFIFNRTSVFFFFELNRTSVIYRLTYLYNKVLAPVFILPTLPAECSSILLFHFYMLEHEIILKILTWPKI